MEQTFENDEMKAVVMLKWSKFKSILGKQRLDHGKAFAFIRELTEEISSLPHPPTKRPEPEIVS